MSSRNLALSLLAASMLIGIVQQIWYWPQLPERVATHFGIDGQPNDWMSRKASTALFLGMQLGVPLFMLSVTAMAARLPDSMVNIPHREYWLHPDRRTTTLSHMSTMMTWIAVAVSVFMMAIGYLTFAANRTGTGLNMRLSGVTLIGFLITVFTIAGSSLWRFRQPK